MKTSSTRSYIRFTFSAYANRTCWNELGSMSRWVIFQKRLEWFSQTGFVNWIALSQRSDSKYWFTQEAYRTAYGAFGIQSTGPVPLRSHCAHTSTPRRRSCQWCNPVLTAGGAAVTGSSSLRANRERAKRTLAACVHGLWEDLTAALRSSTASQTLEHTLRQAKTKPAALKLQLDKKVRVYFESIEGYY